MARAGHDAEVEVPTWAQYKKKRGKSAKVASYERLRRLVAARNEKVQRKRAEEVAVESLVAGFAKECAIPLSSFQRSLKADGAIVAPGKAPALPAACDARLKALVLYRVAFGFGVNWAQVRALALTMAHQLGIASFKASNGWLEGFKKRHKAEIQRHAAQTMGHKKDATDAAAVSPNGHMLANACLYTLDPLSLCFSDLKEKEEQINAHIKPWRVWNLGEISSSADEATRNNNSEARDDQHIVSAVHCVNAQGDSLPLLLVVPPKKSATTRSSRSSFCEVNVQSFTSPTGVLTEDVWAANVAPTVRSQLCEFRCQRGESDNVWNLLIIDEDARVLVDSCGSLLDLFENKILVVGMPSVPPQPVTATLYEPLHAEYRKLAEQQRKSITRASSVDAFEACGVYPLKLSSSAAQPQSAAASPLDAAIATEASGISSNDDDDGGISSTSFSPRSQHCEEQEQEQDAAVDAGNQQALTSAQNRDNFARAVADFAHAVGLSHDVAARVVAIGMDVLLNASSAASSEHSVNV